jgi:AraC family transcriptional regulator
VSPDTFYRVLVHIQANLDDDLSRTRMAMFAGPSTFHFAREFTRAAGETPKQYTIRLRLERAALRLLLHEDGILSVAIDCGFANHETFSRAFRRQFDMLPSVYRKRGIPSGSNREHDRKSTTAVPDNELSQTKIVQLKSVPVAFLRNIRPYETVKDNLWDELLVWAKRHRLAKPWTLLGIAHDAPGITPSFKLRFDAALYSGSPLPPSRRIGKQTLPEGPYAMTTCAGPYPALAHAYQAVFRRLRSMKGVAVSGVPAIEIYHTNRVVADLAIKHTDVYVPVVKLPWFFDSEF